MKKSFNHPVLGKIDGYFNMKEFDKAIKDYNNKDNIHLKKMQEMDKQTQKLSKDKDVKLNKWFDSIKTS